MPMWPWWILSNISFRIEVGIRILSPLRMIPFSSDIQSLTSQYMPVLLLRQAFVPGHPRLMISLRCVSDSSLAVSSRFSSSLGFASGRLDCIRWPWSAFFPLPSCYHSVVSGIDAQDSMSGSNNSLPAYILVCSRTFCILSRILYSLGGTVDKAFFRVFSWGLWFDSTGTFFPYVYWLNRSRLNSTAKSSFSVCAFLDSASVKDLDA